MAHYNYKAINDKGRKISGEIIADNPIDLETRLKDLGLDLISWKETQYKKAGRFSKVQNKDLIVLCVQMEQLSRAGVPLLEALADVRDSTDSLKLRDILAGVYEEVKGGALLSQALAKFPDLFDDVFIGLIKAGEKTGDMSEVYHHLAEHFKWTHSLKSKIRKALGYPIFLILLMTVVISILMIFVVPQLIDFITSQGFDIPIHTRALIAFSDAMVNYWYLILGTPIITIIFAMILYKHSESFAYTVDSIALKLPIVGDTIRKINLARFTHFFAVMFRSGVDILESLEGAKNVVNNRVLKESIAVVKTSISEGSSLTEALRMSNQFPNMVVRMFGIGENSGNMNDALENVNFFYNKEVNDAVDSMIGMIQPALTIVMGALVFWVVSAVFGPLYQAFSDMPF